MKKIFPGIEDLEWYEFDYALSFLKPVSGWKNVSLPDIQEIETQIEQRTFFSNVSLKPSRDGRIVLDESIAHLSQILCRGLVDDACQPDWVSAHFYFDLRGFLFFPRTKYFSSQIIRHFGGKPCYHFEPRQKELARYPDIGLREFNQSNVEINEAFVNIVKKIIAESKTPFLLTIAGPSGSGKTEIVERLEKSLRESGKSVASIEMDNFFKDGDFRDGKVLDQNVIFFDLFKESLQKLLQGETVSIPRYNFITTRSSHDINGVLRVGESPLQVEPADIIFLEGNFPFHLPEIARWIGLRIVYLTDDPIRLKRKWRRDIDYRKKYDQVYFINRYFRTQFLRAQEVYLPLMEISDMVVDTTAAALWLTPELKEKIHFSESTQ